MLGRAVALVFLVTFLPTLLLIGFVLRTNSNEPVLLTDEILRPDGTKLRMHRLRTTGRGSRVFRSVGRFIRGFGLDDLPALWDVVRGQIELRQFWQIWQVGNRI
jgi:lipopolysaccharide/colanic/teichoic acid biosynthesis glycosyltransferase